MRHRLNPPPLVCSVPDPFLHIADEAAGTALGRSVAVDGLLPAFLDLDGEAVGRSNDLRAEDDLTSTRREGDVRLEAVVVAREVHQFLRSQDARLNQLGGVCQCVIGAVRHDLGTEEINPLTVAWRGDAGWPATISREESAVGRL